MPSEKHDELPLRRRQRSWTRPEDYLDLDRLARRAAARQRERSSRPISEAPNPRPTLGMIPFALLMAAMAVLAVMVMIAAVPGKNRAPARPAPAEQQAPAPVEMELSRSR